MRKTAAARQELNRQQRDLLNQGLLSDAEKAEFRSQLAAVKAEDDRRREPAPQLDLEESA